MTSHRCPGLTGDWLNAWLAAIGITVLIPDARLSWTTTQPPVATIHTGDVRPLAEQIAERLPTPQQWWDGNPAIAPAADTEKKNSRKMTPEEYLERAQQERQAHSLTLAASLTDLAGRTPNDSHSPFDPAAPGSTGGVFHRVLDCLTALPGDPPERVEWILKTLEGPGRRVAVNGLGFDIQRIVSGSVDKDARGANANKKVDPVIETLAHEALAHFPVRGDGSAQLTRGWMGRRTAKGSFAWPCWSQPLDRWAVDALLDRFTEQRSVTGDDTTTMRARTRSVGVTKAFRVVPYEGKGGNDKTRGYGSQSWW